MKMRDVERAIADAVAVGLLEPQTPAGEVHDLVISYARSLEGIEELGGLETLSLIASSIDDYTVLSRLPALRVLVIEHCDLDDVGWVSTFGLQAAIFRRNRLRDALELVALSTLQYLDLTGNPLTAQTRAAAKATTTLNVLLLDDDELAAVNVRLADAGKGVVAYRTGDQLFACATGPGLTPVPEAGHVSTSVQELESVVAGVLAPSRLLHLEAG
jgi:hypothetical protein